MDGAQVEQRARFQPGQPGQPGPAFTFASTRRGGVVRPRSHSQLQRAVNRGVSGSGRGEARRGESLANPVIVAGGGGSGAPPPVYPFLRLDASRCVALRRLAVARYDAYSTPAGRVPAGALLGEDRKRRESSRGATGLSPPQKKNQGGRPCRAAAHGWAQKVARPSSSPRSAPKRPAGRQAASRPAWR